MNWTHEQFAEHMQRMAPSPEIITESSTVIDTRSEAQIEAECTKLLEEDGWRALRTDPVSDRGRGKGFGELGMADHLYVRYSFPSHPEPIWRAVVELAWVEFKSAKGKPAKHQIAWHQKERARGALTLIAGVDFVASVQGFRDWYANSGLMRRKTV